jgi:hypothetical protein
MLYNYYYGEVSSMAATTLFGGIGGISSVFFNGADTFDFLPKPTGGGSGYSTSASAYDSGGSGGAIFCPYLNLPTLISVAAPLTAVTGSTYASYYGCGGSGSNVTSIVVAGGNGGNYGGGGGGGAVGVNGGNNSSAGGNGAGGCVVIISYG